MDGIQFAQLERSYLIGMRLHEFLFPETAYRLEGSTINPKSTGTFAQSCRSHTSKSDTASRPAWK